MCLDFAMLVLVFAAGRCPWRKDWPLIFNPPRNDYPSLRDVIRAFRSLYSNVSMGDLRLITTIDHISPHWAIMTSIVGRSSRVRTFSILRTTSIPSTTRPKTTCLSLSHGVSAVVMKNWEPLVLGPEFWSRLAFSPNRLFFIQLRDCERERQEQLTAILNNPGVSCLSWKFSSAKDLVPYIEVDPVPSPCKKSPPWIMKSLILQKSSIRACTVNADMFTHDAMDSTALVTLRSSLCIFRFPSAELSKVLGSLSDG